MKTQIHLIQKKKLIITNTLAIFALAASLSGCNSKNEYLGNIAVVDGKAVSQEEYAKELDFYQKYYSKKYGEDYLDTEVSRGKTNNDILSEQLIDSMIKDQVMLNDLNDKNVNIDDNRANKIKKKLEEGLGGKDSLKANIMALNVKDNEFNNHLYRDSIRYQHYDYYINNNDIKDSEILEFYKDNPKYQKMYKYNALVFDDLKQANQTYENIQSAKDFKSALKADVRNYDICNSDFVYDDDPILKASGIMDIDEVSDIFEYDNQYMILMVNSYNDNENELLINVKDIYLNESYLDYLNKLVKKSRIKVFS